MACQGRLVVFNADSRSRKAFEVAARNGLVCEQNQTLGLWKLWGPQAESWVGQPILGVAVYLSRGEGSRVLSLGSSVASARVTWGAPGPVRRSGEVWGLSTGLGPVWGSQCVGCGTSA